MMKMRFSAWAAGAARKAAAITNIASSDRMASLKVETDA
jgi:hypothetical protein